MMKSSKSLSLKCKILSSLLIVSILSSLIIYGLFNLVIAPDVEMYIGTELLNATTKIEKNYNLLNKDIPSEEKFKNLINILSTEINNSKLISSVHIALFDSSYELLYPYDNFMPSLTTDLLDQAFTSIDFKNQGNSIKLLNLTSNNNSYYATIIKTDIYKDDYLLLYLSKDIVNAFLKPINSTMIFILALTTLTFIIISYFMAISLSKPINQLSKVTKDISNGEYTPIEITGNIKEIIELNKNINDLVNKLKKYHSAQKVAFQNASHELRTPLMSIQGYAEAIKYSVFDDLDTPTDVIISETKRLSLIVDGLLTLSKLDTYDFKVNLERLNLYDILKDYSDRLLGITYKENSEILIDCSKDISIYTDEYLLSSATINLLSNCLRYANNIINISVESNESNITIKITDDGKGFDECDLENIFSRFYKGKGGNFGLGLAIAKASIKYLNGDVTATNSLDGGAQFIINLPLK